jgi:hypothetical protein
MAHREDPMPIPLAPLADAHFDHVGVVVPSLVKGRAAFAAIHGIAAWTQAVTDPVNGVHVLFGRDPAGMVYELLEPIDASSPVHAALGLRKNLNHVAYRIADLATGAAAMRAVGCAPVGEPTRAVAFDNGLIQFFVTPLYTVIELIEAPWHVHSFVA